MFGCGLGKQEPYAHSGRHGEGEAEAKKTGFIGAEGAQLPTRLDLFTSGGGRWTAGTQYRPAPASARVGYRLGIHIQGLRAGRTL